MHFTVTLAGLKNVNRYIGNIVLSKIVLPEFHCISLYRARFADANVLGSQEIQIRAVIIKLKKKFIELACSVRTGEKKTAIFSQHGPNKLAQ